MTTSRNRTVSAGGLVDRSVALLTTVTGNTFLVVGSAVLGGLASLVGWVPPRGLLVYRIARLWSRLLLLASGGRLQSTFEARLDQNDRYIFMSNHQSMFDIPALIVSLPVQTRFIAKRSLFQIPIFGWAMKAGGFISVDRHDRSRARESFLQAVQQLQTGASTVVFPEGTRTLDGRILPFERGGFLLALKSGLPIVPVGIRGSLGMQRRGSFGIRPGRIQVSYGRPIATEGYSLRTKTELIRRVREEIIRLSGSVAAEATEEVR